MKRRALAAVYALARQIDDIGDGTMPERQKLAALAELSEKIDALAEGRIPDPDDPVLVAVAHAASVFPLPVTAFHEIVAGCEQDAVGKTYESIADTVAYCRLVAGSVGRLSLEIFGAPGAELGAGRSAGDALALAGARGSELEEPATLGQLADDLGVALQLTNILRDVIEDQRMGRCYLPRVELERFGVTPESWKSAPGAQELIRVTACRAVGWFECGLELLKFLDYRSRACTAAMAGIYRQVLERIRLDPGAPLRRRVSLTNAEKAGIAARSLAGLRP